MKQRPSTARQTADDGEETSASSRPTTAVKKVSGIKPLAPSKRSESKDPAAKTEVSKDTTEQKKKENERRLEEAK